MRSPKKKPPWAPRWEAVCAYCGQYNGHSRDTCEHCGAPRRHVVLLDKELMNHEEV